MDEKHTLLLLDCLKAAVQVYESRLAILTSQQGHYEESWSRQMRRRGEGSVYGTA